MWNYTKKINRICYYGEKQFNKISAICYYVGRSTYKGCINIKNIKNGILSGNQLKIIAAVSMTLDHIGVQIFPRCIFLRIIGRIAFPVFAYMIAEGCKYTKNRKKYLLTIAVSALVCQLAYFIALDSLRQCVLVTFSLSVVLIYALDNAVTKKTLTSFCFALLSLTGAYFLTEILPDILSNTDYSIDYNFAGVLLPTLIFLGRNKNQKLLFVTVSLIILSLLMGGVQWYCMLSVVFLALYNGRKGKANMKYFFYIYYPAHLLIIYLISLIIG